MLTFGEIKSRYEGITGAKITREALADRIDDAQVEVAKRYGKVVTHEYEDAEAGEEYDLPSDHLITQMVKDSNGDETFAYTVTPEGKIIFTVAGDYTLQYTKVPDPIDREENDSVPEVHDIFHQAILKFCIARHWEEISEGIPSEEAKAKNLKNDFFRMVDEAAHLLRRRTKQQYNIAIEPWWDSSGGTSFPWM